jgi:23S rRNA (pseudouridine1915-N3)-methyltransferase
MNVHVVVFLKKTEKFYENAAAEYAKRLGRYCKLQISRIPPGKPFPQPEGFCVLVQPGERMLSSEELAAEIEKAQVRGVSRVTVVLAGDEEIAGDWSPQPAQLALSPMEMSPGLMLTVALEQLYRAYKIINGESYHK